LIDYLSNYLIEVELAKTILTFSLLLLISIYNIRGDQLIGKWSNRVLSPRRR
jgi:hypothetical protein